MGDRPAASGDLDLAAVAETLAELRVQIEGGHLDPVTAGALMTPLGEQVNGAAGGGAGARVAERFAQPEILLGERGAVLSAEGMEH